MLRERLEGLLLRCRHFALHNCSDKTHTHTRERIRNGVTDDNWTICAQLELITFSRANRRCDCPSLRRERHYILCGRCCLDNALPRNTLHYVAILSTESPQHFYTKHIQTHADAYDINTHQRRWWLGEARVSIISMRVRIMFGAYRLRVRRPYVFATHMCNYLQINPILCRPLSERSACDARWKLYD